MKCSFGKSLTLISLLCLIGTALLWARSDSKSDSVRFATVRQGPMPWKLKTIAIFSSKGCLQFATVEEAAYVPENQRPLSGFYHVSGSAVHPESRWLNLGWQKSFAGFGVTKDWDVPPSPTRLVALPIVGRLYLREEIRWTESLKAVWVPDWFLLVIFGLLPARSLYRRIRRYHYQQAGRCQSCGYDLRGGPERCPECGAASMPIHDSRANSASISAS